MWSKKQAFVILIVASLILLLFTVIASDVEAKEKSIDSYVDSTILKNKTNESLIYGNVSMKEKEVIVDSTPKIPSIGQKSTTIEGELTVTEYQSNATYGVLTLKIPNFDDKKFGAAVSSVPTKEPMQVSNLNVDYGLLTFWTTQNITYKTIDVNKIYAQNDKNTIPQNEGCLLPMMPTRKGTCWLMEKQEVIDTNTTVGHIEVVYGKTVEEVKGKTAYVKVTAKWKASLGYKAIDLLLKYGDWRKELAWFNTDFTYKQKITFDTSPLASDVTNDHTVLVFVPASNTDYWDYTTNTTDWNGTTFTNAAQDTEYNFDVEQYINDVNAVFWVLGTDTWDATTDSTGYMYYSGPNTNYSDGTAAYGSDLNYFIQFKDGSESTASDATASGYNGTLSNSTGWVNGPTGKAWKNVDGANMYVSSVPASVDFTMLMQVSRTTLDPTESTDMYLSMRNGPINYNISFSYRDPGLNPCAGKLSIFEDDTRLCATTAATVNTWFGLGISYVQSTGSKKIYSNGANEGNEVDSLNIQSTNVQYFAYSSTGGPCCHYEGIADNIRMYERVLSDEEVKLLYLSDSKGLVSFGAKESQGGVVECACPTTGDWMITDGSICVMATNCSPPGNVVIRGSSLTLDANLTLAAGKKIFGDFNTATIFNGTLKGYVFGG